jgi:hypothetical protein
MRNYQPALWVIALCLVLAGVVLVVPEPPAPQDPFLAPIPNQDIRNKRHQVFADLEAGLSLREAVDHCIELETDYPDVLAAIHRVTDEHYEGADYREKVARFLVDAVANDPSPDQGLVKRLNAELEQEYGDHRSP